MKDNWFENKLGQRLNESNNLDLDVLWMELEKKRAGKKRALLLPLLGVGLVMLLVYAMFHYNNSGIQPGYENLVSSPSPHFFYDSNDLSVATKSIIAELKTSDSTNENLKPSDDLDKVREEKLAVKGNAHRINPEKEMQKNPVLGNSSIKQLDKSSTRTITDIDYSNKSSIVNETNLVSKTLLPESALRNTTLPSIKRVEYLGLNIIPSSFSPMMSDKEPHPFDTKVNSTSNHNWYYGVSFDFGTANRSLVSEDQNSVEIVSKRGQDEKMLDQLSGKVFFGKKLQNHFFVETGLSFSQYTSKSEFSFIENKTIQIIDTIEINVNPGGEILSIKEGPIAQVQQSTRQIRYYQKYQSIGIPISIGKYWQISSKMDLALALGTQLELFTRVRGNIQSQITPIVAFQTLNETGYYKGFNISGLLNFNLLYDLGNENKVSIGANYKVDLRDRAHKAAEFNDKFQSLNLQVGWFKGF